MKGCHGYLFILLGFFIYGENAHVEYMGEFGGGDWGSLAQVEALKFCFFFLKKKMKLNIGVGR